MDKPKVDTKAWPEELTVRGWDRYRGHFGIKPPVRCRCGDVRFFVMDVDRAHPNFARLVPCPRCNNGHKAEPADNREYPPFTVGDF